MTSDKIMHFSNTFYTYQISSQLNILFGRNTPHTKQEHDEQQANTQQKTNKFKSSQAEEKVHGTSSSLSFLQKKRISVVGISTLNCGREALPPQ